jgi:hypothetical protein
MLPLIILGDVVAHNKSHGAGRGPSSIASLSQDFDTNHHDFHDLVLPIPTHTNTLLRCYSMT